MIADCREVAVTDDKLEAAALEKVYEMGCVGDMRSLAVSIFMAGHAHARAEKDAQHPTVWAYEQACKALEKYRAECAEKDAEIWRLREALKFYADPETYEGGHNDDVGSTGIDIDYRGSLARQTLEESTKPDVKRDEFPDRLVSDAAEAEGYQKVDARHAFTKGARWAWERAKRG